MLVREEKCFFVHDYAGGSRRELLKYCDEGEGRQWLNVDVQWKDLDHDGSDELVVMELNGFGWPAGQESIWGLKVFGFSKDDLLRENSAQTGAAARLILDRESAKKRSLATVYNMAWCLDILGEAKKGIALIDDYVKSHPEAAPNERLRMKRAQLSE